MILTSYCKWIVALLLIACTVLIVSTVSAGEPPEKPAQPGGGLLVYIGTYTGGKSKGIYACRLDVSKGAATAPDLVAETESPSFLAIHPGGRFLYAANEVRDGMVSAFSLDPASGKLTFLNRESSGGADPCHLVVDRTGKHVLVANYSSGSVAVLPIREDGRLGASTCRIVHKGSSVNPDRQRSPHAHCVQLDAGNRFALVADLGIDKLVVYSFSPETGVLTPQAGRDASLKPGAGPRHIAFHPEAPFVYSIDELDCTVTAFAYDAGKGSLKEIGTVSTLPGKKEKGFSTAEIEAHPSGKFLYGSNRGHDSIAVFAIDPGKGTLAPVEHRPTGGKTPRSFAIEPAGKLLLAANQDSDTIVLFRIDPASGRLAPTGDAIRVPSPVCVKFLATP